eukprot:NODE_1525_length_1918_cov_7.581058_g1293_i0.p1 GENE.NODE_1525_length_1918_cov_7.581058_g1293_i0~~NODE_1525_length_1918_cov_7.581058_g1293_i0.p1  ORF type:complete len:436 (-),score=49.37 NODE_1525_length_1918_cov_7.581058_g1293_i0:555-1862(-)
MTYTIHHEGIKRLDMSITKLAELPIITKSSSKYSSTMAKMDAYMAYILQKYSVSDAIRNIHIVWWYLDHMFYLRFKLVIKRIRLLKRYSSNIVRLFKRLAAQRKSIVYVMVEMWQKWEENKDINKNGLTNKDSMQPVWVMFRMRKLSKFVKEGIANQLYAEYLCRYRIEWNEFQSKLNDGYMSPRNYPKWHPSPIQCSMVATSDDAIYRDLISILSDLERGLKERKESASNLVKTQPLLFNSSNGGVRHVVWVRNTTSSSILTIKKLYQPLVRSICPSILIQPTNSLSLNLSSARSPSTNRSPSARSPLPSPHAPTLSVAAMRANRESLKILERAEAHREMIAQALGTMYEPFTNEIDDPVNHSEKNKIHLTSSSPVHSPSSRKRSTLILQQETQPTGNLTSQHETIITAGRKVTVVLNFKFFVPRLFYCLGEMY